MHQNARFGDFFGQPSCNNTTSSLACKSRDVGLFLEHDDVEIKLRTRQIAFVLRSWSDARWLHDAHSRVASSTCISIRVPRILNALLCD